MPFCTSCGNELTGTSKFCSNCGQATKLLEEPSNQKQDSLSDINNGSASNNSMYIDDHSFEKGREDMYNIRKFEAKYLGGHASYPGNKALSTTVIVYDSFLEVVRLGLRIPYSWISNVSNMDEKKISALRVIGLGVLFLPLAIVGAMWKKTKLYTVIQYHDGMQQQALVLDFGKHIDEIQPVILKLSLLKHNLHILKNISHRVSQMLFRIFLCVF